MDKEMKERGPDMLATQLDRKSHGYGWNRGEEGFTERRGHRTRVMTVMGQVEGSIMGQHGPWGNRVLLFFSFLGGKE